MYFKEIELRNFRNYIHCVQSFHEKVNIITGDNGNGKTNLAEALYMMCLARSFRTSREKEMIRFGESFAFIRTVFSRDDRSLRAELKLSQTGKEILINGVKRKRSDLPLYINIVVFSPDDMKIVKEDPDKRRRFINRELCQIRPVYYEALYRYTKVLEQRNSLLREERIPSMMMDIWDEELAAYGAKLILERNAFLERLDKISGEIHRAITNGKETLKIEYEADILPQPDEASQKAVFLKALKENSEKERIRRITLAGPHKDDMKLSVNGIDVRRFGSQGQQRTVALSLKLAEIRLISEETGELPVLILDDVLSELDQKRQDFLIGYLKDVQIFLTATEVKESLLERIGSYHLYHVDKGVISLLSEKK